MLAQHAGRTLERWAGFTSDQHLLMIANELNRAAKLMAPEDRERRGEGVAVPAQSPSSGTV